MEDSSNNEVGSQINESTESETTSNSNESTTNSNGNFSGGFDSSALSNDTFSTDSVPDFGIDFGSNNNSGSFDYNPFDDSGFDLDFGSNNDSGSFDESDPVMTVDEVYGKGNQSIVESQGDYAASSNEKSNVETSTFGKQAEISVTPVSVTKNEGLVNNDAIQSVEGLNFQQKDKASQDVLEAKKDRDEAEAKDKANQMRDSLLANIGKPIGKQGDGDVSKFQVGEKNTFEEQNKAKLDELNNLKKGLNGVNKDLEEAKNAKIEADKKAEEAGLKLSNLKDAEAKAKEALADLELNANELKNGNFIQKTLLNMSGGPALASLKDGVQTLAKQYGVDLPRYQDVDSVADAVDKLTPVIKNYWDSKVAEAENELNIAQKQQGDIEARQNDLISKAKEFESRYDKANQEYKTWKTEYWTSAEKTKAEEEAPAVTPNPKVEEKAPVTTTPKSVENTTPDQVFDNAIQEAIKKGADEETVQAMTTAATNIKNARDEVKQAIERDDMPAYIEAQKHLNKNYEDALKIGNAITQTDLSKSFTTAVAKSNDFKVTLPDGTTKDYSQFATEMVTKSPEIAKAMYEAKADKLAKDGHKVLAAIETAKSKMVMTWLGSKFTFADNQVRNQFNQMVETDVRATYAANNNVLNDPNATPEQKAEASAAIAQANALKVASTALKASTGFWSGIGDSMKDGVYGKTDPQTLNTYQKTLNTVDNLARITLGLGVTPGANKAYQNMYYMAGAKVNESGLFSKDWDKDGFALCQEYGNNAAAGMIAGVGELATGVALMFNPAMSGIGLNLTIDSVQTFLDGLYGVQKDVRKSQKYTQEVVSYFEEAKDIAEQSGNEEAVDAISDGITQIENFELKPDEVGNLNNWLEGSGSNTADNGKFNQSLSYDEWLKLIEADPTMRDYAKKLIAEKKEK